MRGFPILGTGWREGRFGWIWERFKPQVLTIHAYGEEAAVFGREDAWVGFPEFSSSVVAAREAGATNMQFNTTLGSWSYVDCLMIVRGAENEAAAHAYINSALSDEGQLASTAHSLAFPVNGAAVSALPETLQYESSDDVLARALLLSGVMIETDGPDVPCPTSAPMGHIAP